jgi:hypothetical protein
LGKFKGERKIVGIFSTTIAGLSEILGYFMGNFWTRMGFFPQAIDN